jgi:hypothetical protein
MSHHRRRGCVIPQGAMEGRCGLPVGPGGAPKAVLRVGHLHAGVWGRIEYAPKCTVRLLEKVSNLLKILVGAGRFERPTPCAQVVPAH